MHWQLIPTHDDTVAMATDDTVACGLGPVSAHPSMRSMLRCSCTAGAVVVRPSDQVDCDACGAYQHSSCAGYPQKGRRYLCHRCSSWSAEDQAATEAA